MHRVIVCDDERHIVRLIQVNLERQGYLVRTCYDGASCIELARREKPGLIVLDKMLPDMSSEEIIAVLEADKSTAGIKTIVLDQKRQGSESSTR